MRQNIADVDTLTTGKAPLSAARPAIGFQAVTKRISNLKHSKNGTVQLNKGKKLLTGHFKDSVLESSMISSSLIFFSTGAKENNKIKRNDFVNDCRETTQTDMY